MPSKTPSYIQQTSTLNAVAPHIVPDAKQQAAQLSSILTDLTLLTKKVNLHEKQISTLVSS
jgi:cAMP phosphodiesterase